MFNKKLEDKINKIDKQAKDAFIKIGERLSKIEEQLKPKPAFKKGELVHFFLCGKEMEGEIMGRTIDIYGLKGMWNIKYLDNINIVNSVSIPEEDIWTEEIFFERQVMDRLDEIETRLNEIKLNKKKYGKKV